MDEADRMLDLGFEREMSECLEIIKERCPKQFEESSGQDNFRSTLRVNFVSATMSKRVEALGKKLMSSYETVGFSNNKEENEAGEDLDDDEKLAESIPKQVLQFYMQVPTQYRLVYLL